MIKTAIKLITAAKSNAVSTANAKTHLKVDYSDSTENTYIDSLIVASQRLVESYTNLVLSDTGYDFQLSSFPVNGIVLPFSPLMALTHIKYFDSDNNEQTWANTNYTAAIAARGDVDKIVYINSPPDTYGYRTDAVNVRCTFGFTSPDTAPEDLIHAIKLLLTDLYENRADMPREKFTAWKTLCYPYRVFHSTTENQ